MKKIVLFILITITNFVFSQQKTYYNYAVNSCQEESSEGMINNCIKGSYLLNYDFKTIEGKTVSTNKIRKPIVIIAASTRFAPCWGQLPALNKMVEKYGDKLEFLMIFRDNKEGINKMAEKLNKKIKLIPPTKELENKAHIESFGFVHKLDYPTIYLIGKNKQFIDIERGAVVPTKTMGWDLVNEKNIETLENFLTPAL